MNKNLEVTFNLAPICEETGDVVEEPKEKNALDYINDAVDLDKIDAALPGVKDLSASDVEMDVLADAAKTGFTDLMDLGMSVEAKYAGEIFGVAANLLGHSITAKKNKIEKKLWVIELQLKKLRLDQQKAKDAGQAGPQPTEGDVILDRKSLIDQIIRGSEKHSK